MKRRRFSDQDVERLLSGRIPEEESLARLAPLLDAMRREHFRAPDEQAVARFATEAAAMVATSPLEVGAPPARSHTSILMSTRRFVATAAGFALVLGMTGVAAASNAAAPGHLLYGVDLTLESIGINAGGPGERIAEAQVLFAEGKVSEAIAHAAEALRANEGETQELSPAAEALRGAAGSVAGPDDAGESPAVRDSVAAMLAEMADMIASGESNSREFGQRIAELARLIRGDNGDIEPGRGSQGEGKGPPDSVPANPSQGTPNPPGKGSPGGGPPATSGSPATGGPPGGGPPGRP